MTQVFYCSTFFGAMTIAAAIDDGRFGEHTGRRLLLVSNNAAVPEVTPPVTEAPGFAALRTRFDDVVSWNDVIAPLHPSDWTPRALEEPMLRRLLSRALSLDGPLTELVLESVAVAPSRTLAALLPECPITVYSDGLMSYGPTRSAVPEHVLGRITRLLYLDLVPGLTPLLLREGGVPARALPHEAFRTVLAELPAPPALGPPGAAMIVGQYLSALEVLSGQEEVELYAGMLRGLAARGHRHVLFKPHPAAGPHQARALRHCAQQLAVELTVVPEAVPAEACFAALRPELVVGCFSTALLTAQAVFGLPVATAGADRVLAALTPYENSNRIPLTIVAGSVPELGADGTLAPPPQLDLPHLVTAVGYCMQAATNPDLRAAAAGYLAAHGPARWFRRRRLEALGLLAPPRRSRRSAGAARLRRLRSAARR